MYRNVEFGGIDVYQARKRELFQRHIFIMLYIGSYPPGARYMYLNFLRVDSEDGDQTEMKFYCS